MTLASWYEFSIKEKKKKKLLHMALNELNLDGKWKSEWEWANIMSYVKWLCNFYDKNRKYVQIDTSQITFYVSFCSHLTKCYFSVLLLFYWHSCLRQRRRHDTKTVFLLYHQCNLLIKFTSAVSILLLHLTQSRYNFFLISLFSFSSRWNSSIIVRSTQFSA